MSAFHTMQVIRVNAKNVDPAVSLDTSKVQEYARTRDRAHLEYLPGATPDLFQVQKLPATYLAVLSDNFAMKINQKAVMAFCMACHEVVCGDGTSIKLEPSELQEVVISGKKLSLPKDTDSWIEKVTEEFGYETILEIGQVAIDFAGLSKRATPFFNSWVGMAQSR